MCSVCTWNMHQFSLAIWTFFPAKFAHLVLQNLLCQTDFCGIPRKICGNLLFFCAWKCKNVESTAEHKFQNFRVPSVFILLNKIVQVWNIEDLHHQVATSFKIRKLEFDTSDQLFWNHKPSSVPFQHSIKILPILKSSKSIH